MMCHEREQAYRREHRIAESLQRVLLRTSPQQSLPGIAVASFYRAAWEEATVGGDSFDVFALSGERVALTVADASGKGLDAAERIAEIRFALRAFLREHDDPRQALACLNDFVCDAQRLGRRDDGTFATLTLVVIDCVLGNALCLCAGGEPPLILRTNGSVEAVRVCGPALGLLPHQSFTRTAVRLEELDAVLLTTDGLTEAGHSLQESGLAAHPGKLLGLEGVARLAMQAQNSTASLCQIGRMIFEEACAFAGGTFHDDACLLIGR